MADVARSWACGLEYQSVETLKQGGEAALAAKPPIGYPAVCPTSRKTGSSKFCCVAVGGRILQRLVDLRAGPAVIQREFGVTYHADHVGRLCTAWASRRKSRDARPASATKRPSSSGAQGLAADQKGGARRKASIVFLDETASCCNR